MQAAVVAAPESPYELQEVATPEPAAGQVRIKVEACGFCHSDENIRRGFSGNEFPRIPGHEAAGTIDALGDGVPDDWQLGARVGVGWHGGHCLSCDTCRAGDFKRCPNRLGCGTSYDGGFADYVVVPNTALVRIPDGMDFADAGPIMCGGITVWNALVNSGASWGDVVAIQGIGGLGHMAVQFAAAMGFETVAISGGRDKEKLARELGAHHYIDASSQDAVEELRALGGARAVIGTAPSGASMRPLFDALGPDGRLVIVGVSADEISAPAYAFLSNDRGIQGSVIGTPAETERCLRFAALHGIKPRIQKFPLAEIAKAQEELLANRLRFRAVLIPS